MNKIEHLKSALSPIENQIELKKETADEMAGACPKCGGDDRFLVNPGVEMISLPRLLDELLEQR